MTGFFNLPGAKSSLIKDNKLIKKSKTTRSSSTVTLKGGGTLLDKVSSIVSLVNSKFESKKDTFLLIREESEFSNYIDKCIENGEISIDTETLGLDPILDDIVGMSIYTPGMKAAYIPISHISYISNLLVENQLKRDFLKQQFERINESKTRVIMFNAPFDIRVIGNSIGCWLTPYWDGFIASRLLNENEPLGQGGLKALWRKYCNGGKGDAFSFDKLFEGIPFNYIPITTAYLYAANDAIITYDLYKFQQPYLDPTNQLCIDSELQDVSKVFFEIEMASMPAFISMEQLGVYIDTEYAKTISEKYHKLSEKTQERVITVCNMYKDEMDTYRRNNPGCKLQDPFNPDSPTQLAILLYDILGLQSGDKKNPRGTGVDILEKLDNPVCSAILDNRSFNKALSTYIDKIPAIINPKDGRVHCKFKQIGADTGRTSSDSPNLQNIPSKPIKLSTGEKIDAGHDIRQFFAATEGYVLLSSDYSAQEPRVTAHLSHDEKMIKSYQDGKDVYCEIASVSFGVPYEECKEFRPDGTHNPEGKARRTSAKSIVLGILYGRGIPSIAEQLGKSVKEAQEVYDKVLQSFPGLKDFITESEEMARTKGYVTTVWGRKRRLPDMQLPLYEFKYENGVTPDFDPLSDDEDEVSTEVPDDLIEKFTNDLVRCRGWKQKEQVKEKIRAQGIKVKDNGGFIAQAQRQCVNARVQGSAADLTKIAMIKLYTNQELKDLGFRMLIPVHDEIIAECPKENVKRCAELMEQMMKSAADDLIVPIECDVEVFTHWYGQSLDVNTLLPIEKE